MSAIKRVVLDWKRPVLESVVEYLLDRYGAEDQLQLSKVALVLPSASGGRRLVQRLVLACNQREWGFTPPQTTTVGALPELLYSPKRPFAELDLQLLTWVQILRTEPAEKLQRLTAATPQKDDFWGWLDLAQMLQNLHRELASDLHGFDQVKSHLQGKVDEREVQRWDELCRLQTRYLSAIDGMGYWDRQTARSFAVEGNECESNGEILLIGAVDLNASQRAMLIQASERSSVQITVLQLGQPEDSEAFDTLGCLRVEAWEQRKQPFDQIEVDVVEDPADQALCALDFLATWHSGRSVDQFSVGVPDETVIPFLERQSAAMQIEWFDVAGQSFEQTPLFHWLQSLLEWIETRSFRSLSALVRHPFVFDALSAQLSQSNWLQDLDDYHDRHLPVNIEATYTDRSGRRLKEILSRVDTWCRPVLSKKKELLKHWAQPWTDVLIAWLGEESYDSSDPQQRQNQIGVGKIRSSLAALELLPDAVQPKCEPAVALRWVLRRLAGERIIDEPAVNAIPLIGWLDLPWDDASHVVVTGFNEGRVPSPETADPFLTNELRRQLGIMHRSRRLARDAYYLSLLAQSKERLRLVVGKRGVDKDPLVPSQLLFADDPSGVVSRALQCFDEPPIGLQWKEPEPSREEIKDDADGSPSAAKNSTLGLPATVRPESPLKLSPTDFGRYIACPYRFYLHKYLRLQELDDRATEMHGGQFGELLHDALRAFGESKSKHSEQQDTIEAEVLKAFEKLAREKFQHSHFPAVDLQLEHARQRLREFARIQAEWAASGWRIQSVENADLAFLLTIEQGEVTVGGRIDRIDYHAEDDAWMILDYKSGETAMTPEKAHLTKKGGDWLDLQLPMYYWMLKEAEGDAKQIGVGYVSLAQSAQQSGFKIAAWDSKVYESALRRAEEIAAAIAEGNFGPPTLFREREFDPYRRLMDMPFSQASAATKSV